MFAGPSGFDEEIRFERSQLFSPGPSSFQEVTPVTVPLHLPGFHSNEYLQPNSPLCHIDIRFKKMSPSAIAPSRAYSGSVGIDLFFPEDKVLLPNVWTGIDVKLSVRYPPFTFGMIVGRSSAIKNNIFVFHGCLDPDYQGSIMVYCCSFRAEPYLIPRGNSICQFIPQSYRPYFFRMVDDFDEYPTSRAQGSFGSSGNNEGRPILGASAGKESHYMSL